MTVYQSIPTFIAHAPATGIDRYENKMYLLGRLHHDHTDVGLKMHLK